MRTHIALLLLFLPSTACDDSPATPGDAALSFETLVQASTSGFSESQRRVVDDAADWAQTWQTLYAGQSPLPALPAVDFGREIVILAAAGPRSNGCYAIEITRVSLTRRRTLEVDVTETVPGPACVCTQAVTQPAHLVKVERVSAPVNFVDRLFQRAC